MVEIEAALSTKQAARHLGVSPGTLAVWRSRLMGPPCHYSGAKPVYYLPELRDWQRQCAAERMRSLLDRQTPEIETAST